MEQNFWEQRNLVKMNFGEMTCPIIFGAARARKKLHFLWDQGNIYPPPPPREALTERCARFT